MPNPEAVKKCLFKQVIFQIRASLTILTLQMLVHIVRTLVWPTAFHGFGSCFWKSVCAHFWHPRHYYTLLRRFTFCMWSGAWYAILAPPILRQLWFCITKCLMRSTVVRTNAVSPNGNIRKAPLNSEKQPLWCPNQGVSHQGDVTRITNSSQTLRLLWWKWYSVLVHWRGCYIAWHHLNTYLECAHF